MTYEQLKAFCAVQGKTLDAWTKENNVSRQWVYQAFNCEKKSQTVAAEKLRRDIFRTLENQLDDEIFKGVLLWMR